MLALLGPYHSLAQVFHGHLGINREGYGYRSRVVLFIRHHDAVLRSRLVLRGGWRGLAEADRAAVKPRPVPCCAGPHGRRYVGSLLVAGGVPS